MGEPLLEPRLLARLDQLQLVSRKVFAGRIRGERRSTRKGQSIEFADYRDYVSGDDPRFIDWSIYARLDRLFLKLFMEEQDLQFSVLVDTSESMDYGEPHKLTYAKKLAASLAYIGLARQDRVVVAGVGDGVRDYMPPARGKPAVWRMLEFVDGLQAQGATNLADACRAFRARQKRRGLVVLISDFMDPQGYEAALRELLNRRDDVFVIHTLAPQELEPELAGHLRLVDSETGVYTEITANPGLLERYRETVQSYCGALREFCGKRGIQYLSVTTTFDVEQLVLQYLRRMQLVR